MVRAGFGNVRGKAASLLGTLLFAVLAVLRQGRADSFWWHAASGDFHEGANWTPGGTPPGCGSHAGRYDVASITNGGEVAISDASGTITLAGISLFQEGSNRVVQTGGTVLLKGDAVMGGTGTGADGFGAWFLSGGTVKIVQETKTFCLGNRGTGYLEVSGRGVLDISHAYTHIGGWASVEGTATLNLKTGGTIRIAQHETAQGCIKVNHATKAHVLCDGGVIQLTGAAPSIFFGSPAPVEMRAGGLVVDTGAHVGEIAYRLVGDETSGGLTKRGTGMLTLSGANDYAGNTVVEAGDLLVTSPGALPGYGTKGRVVVKSGARLVPLKGEAWTDEQIAALRANAVVEEGGAIVDAPDRVVFDVDADTVDGRQYFASSAVKTGAGTLTLTATNVFGTSFTVSNGVLNADFGVGIPKGMFVRLANGLLSAPCGEIAAPLGTTPGKANIALIDQSRGGFTTRGDGDLTLNFGGRAQEVALGVWGANPAPLVLNDANATANVRVENKIRHGASLRVEVGAREARLEGGVAVGGELTKEGPGQLTVTNATSAWIKVKGGTLRFPAGSCIHVGTEESFSCVGSQDASRPGVLVVEGGSVTCGGARLLAGDMLDDCAHGRILVRGGTVTMTKANAAFAAGNSGDGYIEVGGGAAPACVDNSNGYACILPRWNGEVGAGSHGEFRILANGTVVSKYGMYAKVDSRPYATFIMDGGTFRASGPCTDVSLTSDGVGFLRNIKNVWMGVNGGVIDTQGHTLYAAQPIEAWTNQVAVAYEVAQYNTIPALTKKGPGTLRLTGVNTYLCATAVDEGTLVLAAGASLPRTPLRMGAAGTLDLGGTAQAVTHLLGSGRVQNGALTAAGDICPGGVGGLGTLTVAQLAAEGRLVVDAAAAGIDKLATSSPLDISRLDLVVTGVDELDRAAARHVFLEAPAVVGGRFRSVSLDGTRFSVALRATSASLVKRGLAVVIR